MESRLKPRHLPTLARGWDPAAPPRTLLHSEAGPLWRDLHNFRAHEGRLARREALSALTLGSIYPPVLFNDQQGNVGNAQVPIVLLSHNPELGDDLASLVCITSREIFLYRAGAWFNLTPVYEVGRVNVTSASTTVSAASGSPLWLSNGVIAGNLVELPKGSNAWYRISLWTETTLTLASPYTGATLTNAEYRIRRTFATGRPALDLPIFAEVFNNDLYVAGPAPNLGGVWVLRADNVWGFPPPTSASILACTYSIQIGIDRLLDTSTSPIVTGMTLLDDGRIVLAMTDNTYRSRIYYSSHLNPAVWSARPGGYTDVTAMSGTLRALGRMGPNLTLHYDQGIALGVPTGEDDPPLAFRRTSVSVGCAANRTLKSVEGLQMFMARDGNVYAFDGASARPLGEPVRWFVRDRRRSRLRIAHASVDAYRREFHLWWPQRSDSLANEAFDLTVSQNLETVRFTWSAESQQWSKAKFSALIGSASDNMEGEPLASHRAEGGRAKGTCLVGLPSYDPNGPPNGGATTPMLFKLSEEVLGDVATGFSGAPGIGGIYAIGDDDDFGMPGVDKTLSHITVWFASTTTKSESFEVGVSSNGGNTWTATTRTLALVAGDEMFAHFFFEPMTAERWRFRLRCPAGAENGMAAQPVRLTVWYIPQSEVEAVER